MVVVLDDIFGLPVTLGAVCVLEGRSFFPGDVLGRPHHSLESPVGAVALPGGDTARQDSLNFTSVKVCEGFGCRVLFIVLMSSLLFYSVEKNTTKENC